MSNLGDINVRDCFVRSADIFKLKDGRDFGSINVTKRYRKPKNETEMVYAKYRLKTSDEYILTDVKRIMTFLEDNRYCKISFMGQISGIKSYYIDKQGEGVYVKIPFVEVFLRSIHFYDSKYRRDEYQIKKDRIKPSEPAYVNNDVKEDIESRTLSEKLPL